MASEKHDVRKKPPPPDPLAVQLVRLRQQASSRGLWRTFRALDDATRAIADDLRDDVVQMIDAGTVQADGSIREG